MVWIDRHPDHAGVAADRREQTAASAPSAGSDPCPHPQLVRAGSRGHAAAVRPYRQAVAE